MIAIDQVLVSDEVLGEQFVCDLSACRGGCCVDGEAGAPLETSEVRELEEIFEQLRPFLDPAGLEEIRRKGICVSQKDSGLFTPTIGSGICAYGVRDNGVVRCGIEKAWSAGAVPFRKPVSCHLYPIRVERKAGLEALNYEPREPLCNPGCILGRELYVPVFRFLKEAIVRKYGIGFFQAMEAAASVHFKPGAEDPMP